MKKILRPYFIETYVLYTVSGIASGMVFGKGIETLLITGFVFMVTSLLAKPIINLLLLPLNLLTFGFFRWVSAAIVLYIVTLIVPAFSLVGFSFAGISNKWIEIPSLNFEGYVAFIAYAFLISLLSSFLYWLFK